MPQPTPGDLHVDHYLTNLSVSWAQDSGKFVADTVFPTVPVAQKSDLYAVYDKGYFYRDEMTERPLGGKSARTGYAVSNQTYNCAEHSLAHPIDDRVRANADQPLDPDRAGMRLLTQQALIHRDRLWAAKYFVTSFWGATDQTGVPSAPSTNQFLQFDQAGADPVGVVDKARDAMGGSTGFDPNVLVLGRDVYRAVKNNASVLDRVKYTQRGIVDEDLLAALFRVDKVIIPGGVQNTAKEGQTNAVSFIVNSKAMLLAYAAPAPSIDTPSAGYTFAWTGLIPGATNAYGGVIGRMRDEESHSDILEIRTAFDVQGVATELGQFFAAAVA
jgi:hypothetical protein